MGGGLRCAGWADAGSGTDGQAGHRGRQRQACKPPRPGQPSTPGHFPALLCRRRAMTGGSASSSRTSTAISTESTQPRWLPSDAPMDVGDPIRFAVPPPGALPLVAPGTPVPVDPPGTPVPVPVEVPAPGLAELPAPGEVEVELPGVGVLDGAGGLPFFGLPVGPTPTPGGHGPCPALSHDGGF